tara:strand:- start:12213 stop:12695 length:483 start_codon:yes stop_codon:yes gene_type:complete
MTTTNNDSQLRTFKLIDKEGYLRHHRENENNLKKIGSEVFCGVINIFGSLVNDTIERGTEFITNSEFKFFEEIANDLPSESSPSLPEQHESQLPYQHLIDDCKAVDGSLCIHKEGVVFLWEDSEYVINSPEDYDNLINSIKVLQSLQKVYNIDSSTNEGE